MVDLRKRIIYILLLFVFILCGNIYVTAADIPSDISAKAAVLMVADTHEILFAKNENEKLSMASTTKIMTALLAIESGRLDEEICVSDEMVRVEGTSIGLLSGDSISVEELVYGMLLESGNDAANVTAHVISGGKSEFSSLMNDKARAIGMNNTNFVTPSGLDDDNHYSTAYDMALLGCYAINNSKFCEICSAETAFVDYGNPPYRRCLTNHNKLLKSYDGVFGIKTGFTKKSGRCLVSAVEKNGIKLVCVTLNAPNDWNDHIKLFDYGFENIKAINIDADCVMEYDVNIVDSNISKIQCSLAYNPVLYGVENIGEYKKEILLTHFLYPPVVKGDVVGNVNYYDISGNMVLSIPIIAKDNIYSSSKENSIKAKNSFFENIMKLLAGEKND